MVANVVSRWPSRLGGESAGIRNVSVPPRRGVSAAVAVRASEATARATPSQQL